MSNDIDEPDPPDELYLQQTPAARPACRVCGDRPSCDCDHQPEGIDDIERRYHRYQQRK